MLSLFSTYFLCAHVFKGNYDRISHNRPCNSHPPIGPSCGDFVPDCYGDPDGLLKDDRKKEALVTKFVLTNE